MSYAWEEFYGAVRTLAGRGDQRDRLTRAFQYNLHLLTVHDHDFSEKLKLDFQKMVERVTEAESFEDTIRQMDEEEVAEVAMQIVDMFETIVRQERD